MTAVGAAPIAHRPQHCCMCDREVLVATSTTRDPEAPEMIQLPVGAWIGFVQGDHAPEMVVVCSETCRRQLLST